MNNANIPHEVKNTTQTVLKDDETAKNIALSMESRIETFNPHRRQLLNEVKANISYLVGEQDIELVGDEICPIPRERAINCTVNVMLPAVQKDIAVATSRPPAFDIVPDGTDDDDRATAIFADKGYRHLQKIHGKDLKRSDAVLWYDLSGVGWRKTIWNPNNHVLGINPPQVNENGERMPGHIEGLEEGEAIVEGEVEIISIPTTQAIYDFRAQDLTKLSWFIHAMRVTSAWVLSTFGPEIHGQLSAHFNAGSSGEQSFETNIYNRFANVGADKQRVVTQSMQGGQMIKLESDKYIDYYEYWVKPSKENPAGAYAIKLGSQVVYHRPYPIQNYPHGELPFTPAAPIKIDGATLGAICRVSQARPIQRKINKLCAQIDENVDVMGNAVIFTPRSAKLSHKRLDNGVGNIIEYEGPVGRPTREAGVPMNNQVFTYLQMLMQMHDGIFAFHGSMKGQPPKNIDSAKGIQALQSSDIEHLGPIVDGFERADQTILFQALMIMTANYQPGRLINVLGSDFEWVSQEIDKNQLQGKFNVIVQHRSSMPMDKDAAGSMAFELWGSGLLGDPQDPELRVWVMNQINMGNKDTILKKHAKQQNFAQKEFTMATANLKDIKIPEGISKEQMALLVQQYTFVPGINPFDDHMVHIGCHKTYLIDKYWDFKATGNPLYMELLNNMGNHLAEHNQIVLDQQKAQHDRQLLDQMLLKKATPEQILLGKSKPNDSSKSKGK